MDIRRICVFTATRAEYGLLAPLMRLLRGRPGVRLQVVASGTHLSEAHGMTVREIDRDGFSVDARCDILVPGDSAVSAAASMGLCTTRVAEALERLRPHLFVVLGDRYETLAAAQAAMLLGIPVAHLCGGEVTEGAFDESIRHALTKLSHLHFVAAEPYRRRVLQLGEDPERVFDVGSPGLDNLLLPDLPTRAELEASLGFSLGEQSLLVTYHPATLGGLAPLDALNRLLAAIDRFPEARTIFTAPNADPGGDAVHARLRAHVGERTGRAVLVSSLGQRRYVAALREVSAVVGNSSSGIIEAPAAGTPTVNVGDRQKGRLRASCIIDVPEETEAIVRGIERALSPEMKALARAGGHPYGGPGAAAKMAEILLSVPLNGLTSKTFHDLPGAAL